MLMAAKLMLNDDHAQDKIFVHLQAAAGFDPKTDKSNLRELSSGLLTWATEQSQTDYQGIRKAYLIASCSALEHLAKSCFAAWVMDSNKSSSIRREQVLKDTDDAFQKLKVQRCGGHFQKFRTFALQKIPSQHASTSEAFADVDTKSFDEAFEVRNRLVHHAAEPNERLAKIFDTPSGVPLQITRLHVKRYMLAMDAMADAIAIVAPTNDI